jgi:hypothetical protein
MEGPLCFGSFSQAVSEEKNFLNQPIRNKSRLWWPCLLTDRDEMNNIYREPSIDGQEDTKLIVKNTSFSSNNYGLRN